jgi:ribosomal protein L11 methylase PrmA
VFKKEDSSFRDSDGFVFYQDDQVYRSIHKNYKANWDKLNSTGLLGKLIEKGYLISFEEDPFLNEHQNESVYKIIKPKRVPFISYPFEWSFNQLRSAALLTLKLQEECLINGFSLKDATAYNIQFMGVKPIFIDTTSFEVYSENEPWVAYGQFCRHFLGPLLLFKYNKAELTKLMQVYIDGIPLHVISKSLPFKTKFNFFLYSHIHLHARYERKFSQQTTINSSKLKFNKNRLLDLITHLKEGIRNIKYSDNQTQWINYYDTFSYNENNFEQKKKVVEHFLDEIKPSTLIDLGCNEGVFSVLASEKVDQVVALDFDERVINKLNKQCKKENRSTILPLVYDLMNPSPAIGWANIERKVFFERNKFDCALVLALIHHLAIGNNVPLDRIAEFFSQIVPVLIIEFVPKNDQQTKRLLITKKDIFENYTEDNFKVQFQKYYNILREVVIQGSDRKLFLLKRNG